MSDNRYLDGGDMETQETQLIDPDIALIADYLALELSEEQAKSVFERLVSDEDFYSKALPLMMASALPNLGEAPTTGSRRLPSSSAKGRRRRLPPWAARTIMPRLAAGLIAGAAGLGGFELVAAHTGDIEQRVNKWWLQKVGAAADSTTTRSELLPGNSQAILDGNSRVQVTSLSGGNEAIVQLQGGATFVVTSQSRVITVSTGGGDAVLTPGRYHVQTTGRTMEVRVERGSARLVPRGDNVAVDVKAGETKRVP